MTKEPEKKPYRLKKGLVRYADAGLVAEGDQEVHLTQAQAKRFSNVLEPATTTKATKPPNDGEA